MESTDHNMGVKRQLTSPFQYACLNGVNTGD